MTRSWARSRAYVGSNTTRFGATGSDPLPVTRIVHTTQGQADLEARQVADFAPDRRPLSHRSRLKRVISQIAAQTTRFVELWEFGKPDPRPEPSKHKIIDHFAGRTRLDCDVLIVAADDPRLMVYTAEPGTEYPERLGFAIVLGAQTFVE